MGVALKSAHGLAEAEYARRQKERGWLRANLVLSPSDTGALGSLMARWNVSRQEAVRRAIRMVAGGALGAPIAELSPANGLTPSTRQDRKE